MEAAEARIAELEGLHAREVVQAMGERLEARDRIAELEEEVARVKLQKRANCMRAFIEKEELKAEKERLCNHTKLVAGLVSALTTTDKAIQPELISALTAIVKSFKPDSTTLKVEVEFEDVVKKMTETCEKTLMEHGTYFDAIMYPNLTAQPTTRSEAYELIIQWGESEGDDMDIPEGTKVLWNITDEKLPVYPGMPEKWGMELA